MMITARIARRVGALAGVSWVVWDALDRLLGRSLRPQIAGGRAPRPPAALYMQAVLHMRIPEARQVQRLAFFFHLARHIGDGPLARWKRAPKAAPSRRSSSTTTGCCSTPRSRGRAPSGRCSPAAGLEFTAEHKRALLGTPRPIARPPMFERPSSTRRGRGRSLVAELGLLVLRGDGVAMRRRGRGRSS